MPTNVLAVSVSGQVGREPLPGATPVPDDVLVGIVDGVCWYARPVERVEGPTTSFRELPEDRIAIASALIRWHASDPRCERCHERTESVSQGQRRRCTCCGALLFFRTDPAVIVAITDDEDRLLLARHESWPAGRVSVIAGFVEVGESLEQACHRESLEEVGLELTDVRYFGSQPWPFPRSLMMGFTARAVNPPQLRPDGEEIVEASFLRRQELASRVASGRMTLPGPASIGRALIEAWLAG